MRHLRNLFSALSVLFIAAGLFTLPLQVNAKSSPAPAATTTTTPPTPAPATTPTPPPAPAAAATTPAPAPTPAKTDATPLRAKLIDATDVSTTSLTKGSIDVYMDLVDNGKLDDALANAETSISDKIDLVTIKDKKETVGPVRVDLPKDKTVKLNADDKFLRISGIEKSLKDGDKFQLILHFMRAPNVTVDVTVHKKSSFF